MSIEYRHIRDHIEVYVDGIFVVSADTMYEARKEIKEEIL